MKSCDRRSVKEYFCRETFCIKLLVGKERLFYLFYDIPIAK